MQARGGTLVFTTPDDQDGVTLFGRRVPSLVGTVILGSGPKGEFHDSPVPTVTRGALESSTETGMLLSSKPQAAPTSVNTRPRISSSNGRSSGNASSTVPV